MRLVRIKHGAETYYAIQRGRFIKTYFCEYDGSWAWKRKSIIKYCLYSNFAPAKRAYLRLANFNIEIVTDLEKELK